VPASLLGTEWIRLPTSKKVVALTFDGGANADGAPSILATLRNKDAPGTFFLTGRWVESFPKLAERVGRRYPVGNHTYDHPNLVGMGRSAIREQIRKAEALIGRGCARDPRPLFRFPYGASDARTVGIVNRLGYGSIRWTVDTLGWKGTTDGQSADSVTARVLDGLQPGAIVLMHLGSAPDGSTLDAEALPELIDAIRARGYRPVSVAQFTRPD
jgi:peptidoglycan/xylan/chitin deacetylase (PgdA/CDA1 family)